MGRRFDLQRRRGARSALQALLLLGAFVWAAPGAAAAEYLRGQLLELANAEGFVIAGIEEIQGTPSRRVSGPLARRLADLLRGYDYILLHNGAGAVRELRIMGAHRPAGEVTSRYAVSTTRRGAHHIVQTALTGPHGARRTAELTLDTGATTIVLPEAMIELLGFQAEDLQEGWSETAGGRIPVKLGRLKAVKVGQAAAQDVPVAFLGGVGSTDAQYLLGMSFLQRFRLTVEDAKNEIILMER